MFGRKPVLTVTMSSYTLFILGQIFAPNIQTLLVTRFFSGFFAVGPLTIGGGLLADMWPAEGRGLATSVFSASVFLGPVLGPIVGSFVAQDMNLDWNWVFWVMFIFAGVSTLAMIVFLPETYAPVLLAKKAKKLRKEVKTEDEKKDIFAEHENQDFSLGPLIHRTLFRPFQMLLMEPILVLVTIYMSIVYGVLYARKSFLMLMLFACIETHLSHSIRGVPDHLHGPTWLHSNPNRSDLHRSRYR
jgi:MFS transporter, DHA1 family, multidrug resistance protein